MKDDVEQFEEFSDSVKRGLVDGIKPDPAGYSLLIEKVAAVDESAAVFMRFQAPAMPSFVQHGKLMHAFAWDSTWQGADYWMDIFAKMGGDNE